MRVKAILVLWLILLIFSISAFGQQAQPTREELTSITWQFGRHDGSVMGNDMRLNPDGTISGYYNPNEHRWEFDDNELRFYHEDGRVATIFNTFKKENGKWVIQGPFMLPADYPYQTGHVTHILKQLSSNIIYGNLAFESYNYPGYYIRHSNALGELTVISSDLDIKDSTFHMTEGLAGRNTISFESFNYPGYYLRHQNARIKLHERAQDQLYKEDASFTPVPGLADPTGISFESVNYPGWYLRHKNAHLYIGQNDNSRLFQEDVTFKLHTRSEPSSGGCLQDGSYCTLDTKCCSSWCLDYECVSNGQSADVLMKKGLDFQSAGKPSEAIKCFNKALELTPNNILLWIYKGNAFQSLLQYEEAIQCYDEAISIKPNDAYAWALKGLALKHLMRYTESIDCCNKALSINPNYAAPWDYKGDALYGLGRYGACLSSEVIDINSQ